MSAFKILMVGLGGLLGSIARYAVVKFADEKLNSVFPYGTLTVNVAGSFLLGIVYMLATRNSSFPEGARLFLGVGFCGGFTTFSAFALENFSLLQQRLPATSLLYISSSIVAGIVALAAGVWASRFL